MMIANRVVRKVLFFSRTHLWMCLALIAVVTYGLFGPSNEMINSSIEWAAIGGLVGLTILIPLLWVVISCFGNENLWHYFIHRGKLLRKIEDRTNANLAEIDEELNTNESLTEEKERALKVYKYLLLMSKHRLFESFFSSKVHMEEINGKLQNDLLVTIWYVCNYRSWRVMNKLFDLSFAIIGSAALLSVGFTWPAIFWFVWFMFSSIVFGMICKTASPVIEVIKEETKDQEPTDEEVNEFVQSVLPDVDMSED